MACENSPNLPTASPTNILISLLLLLNQISSLNADVFWTYVPDPPLLQPVGREMSFVPVYVNDTILLGGFSDKHISPQSTKISYSGSSSQLPMCFFQNHYVSGCLTVTDAGYFEYEYDHDRRRWIVDIPSITKSTGDARRVNGTRPKDIPFCGLGVEGRYIAVPWKLCRDETVTVYSITRHTFPLGLVARLQQEPRKKRQQTICSQNLEPWWYHGISDRDMEAAGCFWNRWVPSADRRKDQRRTILESTLVE